MITITKVRQNSKWPQSPLLRSDVLFIHPDHLPMLSLSLDSNIFPLRSCHDYYGRWRTLSLELGQMPFWGIFALLFFLGEQPRIICSFTNTATCQTAMCNVSPPFAGVYLSASSWSSPCKWFGYLGSFYYFVYANMDKRKNGWRYVSACSMEACWALSLVAASG